MDYTCPRCGNPVRRSLRTTAGLVSAFLHLAIGSFVCEKCGTIPQSEFPAEVRSKAMRSSAFLIVGAIVVVLLSLLSFVCEHFW